MPCCSSQRRGRSDEPDRGRTSRRRVPCDPRTGPTRPPVHPGSTLTDRESSYGQNPAAASSLSTTSIDFFALQRIEPREIDHVAHGVALSVPTSSYAQGKKIQVFQHIDVLIGAVIVGHQPQAAATRSGSSITEKPSTNASPDCGQSSVAKIRMLVVLPAPLGQCNRTLVRGTLRKKHRSPLSCGQSIGADGETRSSAT